MSYQASETNAPHHVQHVNTHSHTVHITATIIIFTSDVLFHLFISMHIVLEHACAKVDGPKTL